jgi:2-hydroxy-3-keto-5-methylthiopentenyl-1-phosphate phosphatase
MSEKKIVICDIDGTIANNDHRQHFLEGKKDWDGFFSSLSEDKPILKLSIKLII